MPRKWGNPIDDRWAGQKAPPKIYLTPEAAEHLRKTAERLPEGMVLSIGNYISSESRTPEGEVTSKEYYGISLGGYEVSKVPKEAITQLNELPVVISFPYHSSLDEVHLDYKSGRLLYAETSPDQKLSR